MPLKNSLGLLALIASFSPCYLLGDAARGRDDVSQSQPRSGME